MTDVKRYLRMQNELSDQQEKAIQELQVRACYLSPTAVQQDWLKQVLDIMYSAYEVDPKLFIKEIFFEFHHTKAKAATHRSRVYRQLQELGLIAEEREQQILLVNLYRNLVSDLFDPYLSLLIACLQLKEGKFESFVIANVGQGERNKVEYALARMRGSNLLSGYNPIVRNAVSHAGSESLIYEQGAVVFRNIARGTSPRIDVVKWTNDELDEHILRLIDFVHSIDVSVNIFGIDNYWAIEWDAELKREFLVNIISKEDRLDLQKGFDYIVGKINASIEPLKEKLDALSSFYFLELRKRDLPAKELRFNNENKAVLIGIPSSGINMSDDHELRKRVLMLIRYGIIAWPCFRHHYDRFIAFELGDESCDCLQIIMKSNELELYAKEEAGLYDLLDDSEIFLNQRKIEVKVDFEKLQQMEYSQFNKTFPRKKR